MILEIVQVLRLLLVLVVVLVQEIRLVPVLVLVLTHCFDESSLSVRPLALLVKSGTANSTGTKLVQVLVLVLVLTIVTIVTSARSLL